MTENKLEPCAGECDIINMDHIKFASEEWDEWISGAFQEGVVE